MRTKWPPWQLPGRREQSERTTCCQCHLACPYLPSSPQGCRDGSSTLTLTPLHVRVSPPPRQVLETAGAFPTHTQHLLPAFCHLFLPGPGDSESLLWQGAWVTVLRTGWGSELLCVQLLAGMGRRESKGVYGLPASTYLCRGGPCPCPHFSPSPLSSGAGSGALVPP